MKQDFCSFEKGYFFWVWALRSNEDRIHAVILNNGAAAAAINYINGEDAYIYGLRHNKSRLTTVTKSAWYPFHSDLCIWPPVGPRKGIESVP